MKQTRKFRLAIGDNLYEFIRLEKRLKMALNILVVDDSAVMRKMIIKTMDMCGLPTMMNRG